jgi:peptide/nickel transport system permease protein
VADDTQRGLSDSALVPPVSAVVAGVGFNVAEGDSVAELISAAEPSPSRRRIGLPEGLRRLLSNRKAAIGLSILLFFTFLAVASPVLTRTDASRRSGMPHEAPSAEHPFGTTRRGQDVLDQLIVGARATLGVGVAAGTLATLLAIIFGMTSGYFGGWVDDILSLFINIVLIIPALPLVIVLASFLDKPGPVTIALVLGFTSWAWGARVIRAQMLSLRSRDFVAAAQIIGEPAWRILFVEILPNMTSLVVSGLIGATLYAVVAMVGLEFIGLGNADAITWGTMLFWAQNSSALLTGAWWTFIPPGLAIALLGFSFAMINFAIDEVTNPRLRVEKVAKVPVQSPKRAVAQTKEATV